jgi:hypothetical protein
VKFSRHGLKFIRRNFYVRGDGTCCYYYTDVCWGLLGVTFHLMSFCMLLMGFKRTSRW